MYNLEMMDINIFIARIISVTVLYIKNNSVVIE